MNTQFQVGHLKHIMPRLLCGIQPDQPSLQSLTDCLGKQVRFYAQVGYAEHINKLTAPAPDLHRQTIVM